MATTFRSREDIPIALMVAKNSAVANFLTDEPVAPLALLFAGSSSQTIANHIDDVLQALGVTIVA